MAKNRDDSTVATVEHLARDASRHPDDVAVIENGREMTYRQMYEDLGRMAAAIGAFGLDPGHSAGIEFSRPDDELPYCYLNWLAVLAHDLMETYATNESNTVAVVGADGLARVVPGVQAEVVDAAGEPVTGREGVVRIKSPGCVSGYLGDAEATARMFRDGWFYPGDLAVMEAPDTLRLLGRADDQLNIRGLKYAPHALEEELMRALPVDDLCLTTLADAAGVERVVAVLVVSGPESDAEIWQHLQPLLPSVFGTCAVVRVAEIPRTGTGKVQRTVLDRQLRAAQADL